MRARHAETNPWFGYDRNPVLEEFSADGGPISAVYLPSRHLSPEIRAFIEFLPESV